MTQAELRIITELGKNDCRRVIDATRANWLIMESVGGFSANGGSLDDPKPRRFSRIALSALLSKGLIELRKEVGGSHPEKWYGLTALGWSAYSESCTSGCPPR